MSFAFVFAVAKSDSLGLKRKIKKIEAGILSLFSFLKLFGTAADLHLHTSNTVSAQKSERFLLMGLNNGFSGTFEICLLSFLECLHSDRSALA